jgi:glycosyltransferase involved in cell wall biosynthesis
MEDAGCGLPVITTAMGAGRLVKHGINGLIIGAGDVSGLADAIRLLANDAGLRQRLASRIHVDAQAFTYRNIGRDRAMAFMELLGRRRIMSGN